MLSPNATTMKANRNPLGYSAPSSPSSLIDGVLSFCSSLGRTSVIFWFIITDSLGVGVGVVDVKLFSSRRVDIIEFDTKYNGLILEKATERKVFTRGIDNVS
jgi:hypothetical protein